MTRRSHSLGSVLPVHELSLCQAIAGVVKPHAAGRRVDVVRLQLGALRQVVPDTLLFCWTLVREHEDMPDAELELELVPAAVRCRSCGQQSEIESRFSVACPQCHSADVEVVAGEEFLVTSVDVSEAKVSEQEGLPDGSIPPSR
jgi:hydrogenase nickel incorporation protein HypA/HybF